MEQTISLDLNDLFFQYPHGSKFALGPLSLTLSSGDCIGLMGQNGSGKSTLFSLITGSQKATKGTITLGNQTIAPENYLLKRKIGFLPQELKIPKWVSALEAISYTIGLYGLTNNNLCQETIEYWDCSSFATKPVAACSHGMQKRVGLCLATLHQPELLILDEPFAGLDIYHIQALMKLIKRRSSEKKMTILSSHIAPYVAKLCSRLLTLTNGQISENSQWLTQNQNDRIDFIESTFFSGDSNHA